MFNSQFNPRLLAFFTFLSVATVNSAKAEFTLPINTRLLTASGKTSWSKVNYEVLSGAELSKKSGGRYGSDDVFVMFTDRDNDVCLVKLDDVHYYQYWNPFTYDLFIRQASLNEGAYGRSRLKGTLVLNYGKLAKGTKVEFCFSEVCLND